MDWLRRFMYGRYGGDQLSNWMLGLAITLSLLGSIFGLSILSILGYVPLFAALFRMFSRDIHKRRMENYKFSIRISPLYSRFSNLKNRLKSSKTHKYFKCSKCNTTLRVPRNKGKIKIRCPKCGEEVIKNT